MKSSKARRTAKDERIRSSRSRTAIQRRFAKQLRRRRMTHGSLPPLPRRRISRTIERLIVGYVTSCTMTCMHRSKPRSPTRLTIVPTTRPLAERMELPVNNPKTVMPVMRGMTWQLLIQRPARTGPIRPISQGATQVARTSNATLKVLAMAIWIVV